MDVVEAFTAFDDRGERNPSRHAAVVSFALHGKACLNWQIKQWAEGLSFIPSMAYWFGHIAELLDDFPWLPEWVWKAVINQAEIK